MGDKEIMQAELQPQVRLTERAVLMAKEIMAREERVGHGLRIGVVGGGCSGMKYEMGFDSEPKDGDIVIEMGGLRVFIHETSHPHLRGITVDYVTALHGGGFKFMNPQASRTCGCGESFATT